MNHSGFSSAVMSRDGEEDSADVITFSHHSTSTTSSRCPSFNNMFF